MMHKRLDKAERRVLLRQYVLDDVFDILFDTLMWARSEDDLYPEEVWQETIRFGRTVRDMIRPQRQMRMALEELDEELPTENSALMVKLSTLWALMPEAQRDSQFLENVKWLKGAVEDSELYAEFVIRVGDYEDEHINERRAGVLEYVLMEEDRSEVTAAHHKVMGDVVNEALAMGSECAQKVQLALASVNENYKHAFDEQNRVLIEGIKSLREGRQVAYYNFNTNCQVFTGEIKDSEFKR